MEKVYTIQTSDADENKIIIGVFSKEKGLGKIKEMLADKPMNEYKGTGTQAWEYQFGWVELIEFEVIQ